MIDLKKLKELVKLMTENDLTELDLQDEKGEHVTLKRGGGSQPVQYVQAPAAPQAAPTPAPAAPAASSGGGDAPAEDDGLVPITSPMVGTFYSSPSPDADAFVAVGSSISGDTVVCIVEAMKVFNEIKAETSGTVERIMVENGQPVEFGQPLFLIKPN